MMMLRSQRILLVVGLLLVAWLLHVNFCEWVWKETVTTTFGNASVRPYAPICAWVHDPQAAGPPVITGVGPGGPTATRPGPTRPSYIGLFTQNYTGRTESVLLGIIVPLLLTMLVMYLGLGWRRDARVARGLCAGCGYDLRGLKEPSARCPECGMALAATATR